MKKTMYISILGLLILTYLTPGHAQINVNNYSACEDANSSPYLQHSVCKTMSVSLSHQANSRPNEDKIKLFIRQFPSAKKSKGAVVLITGGPGESGSGTYSQLATMRRSFPDFDIFIPDHRGTGFSTRICEAEEAMDSAGGAHLVGAEWASCFSQMYSNAGRTTQFSMTNAAHDLAHIIQDIQQDQPKRPIYLYGVSYGTQRVLRLFQVAQPAIKGIILDSLVPLQTAKKWELTQRSKIVNDIGQKVLKQCDENQQCSGMMGAPSSQVLVEVLQRIQRQPDLLAKIPDKNLKQFLGRLLDFPNLRDRIPHLIKDLHNGKDHELEKILVGMGTAYAVFGQFPQLAPSIPLVATINGSENNLRPNLTEAELATEEDALQFTDAIPRLMLNSTSPQYAKDEYYGKEPKKFPSILVFMGDMDPKTHYQGAIEHIDVLRKNGKVNLITVKQAPHYISMFAPNCFSQLTSAFIEGKLTSDTICKMY